MLEPACARDPETLVQGFVHTLKKLQTGGCADTDDEDKKNLVSKPDKHHDTYTCGMNKWEDARKETTQGGRVIMICEIASVKHHYRRVRVRTYVYHTRRARAGVYSM